jgi:hypothetical protein
MTKKTNVSIAELRRLANVCKSTGVIVEVEVQGALIRFRPQDTLPSNIPAAEFETLAQWEIWREELRATEAKRKQPQSHDFDF